VNFDYFDFLRHLMAKALSTFVWLVVGADLY
jgi:hypothetical protein